MAQMTRRDAMTAAGAAIAGATLHPLARPEANPIVQKGRLKQSVCRWCYQKIPLPEFCNAVANMGLTAIDLVDEKDWGVLADHGLHCSMAWNTSPGGIPNGLNDPANHDEIVNDIIDAMPRAKKAGVPNIIAFFGNRKGISDDNAIKNCVIGLNRVKKAAEEHELTICVELLNSKVDHKDYQGDRTWFGVEVVKRSPVAAREAPLRHLPYANHGRRRDALSATITSGSPTTTPEECPVGTSLTTRRS